MTPELEELLRLSKIYVESLTPLELEEMHAQQRDSYVRSELQWAKDFREGKCERD